MADSTLTDHTLQSITALNGKSYTVEEIEEQIYKEKQLHEQKLKAEIEKANNVRCEKNIEPYNKAQYLDKQNAEKAEKEYEKQMAEYEIQLKKYKETHPDDTDEVITENTESPQKRAVNPLSMIPDNFIASNVTPNCVVNMITKHFGF